MHRLEAETSPDLSLLGRLYSWQLKDTPTTSSQPATNRQPALPSLGCANPGFTRPMASCTYETHGRFWHAAKYVFGQNFNVEIDDAAFP